MRDAIAARGGPPRERRMTDQAPVDRTDELDGWRPERPRAVGGLPPGDARARRCATAGRVRARPTRSRSTTPGSSTAGGRRASGCGWCGATTSPSSTDPDLLKPPLDRSYKKPGGLRDARQAGGGTRAVGPGEAARESNGRGRGRPTMTTARGELVPATRDALRSSSCSRWPTTSSCSGSRTREWTGIAPLLEEDVAMSSLAQDEIGHAQRALPTARRPARRRPDADAIAYDRPPEGYRHARLLDHARGDWARTIARRYLYDTADAVRLDALAESSSHRSRASSARSAARSRTTCSTSGPGSPAWPGSTGSRAAGCSPRWSGSGPTPGRCSRRCPTTCRCRWPGSSRRRPQSSTRAGGWRSARRSTGSACRCRRRPETRRPPAAATPTRSAGCTAS